MEVCSVEKKDIIEEIKKRNIIQLTIANQADLDKLPPSIKSLFPNGVSENGATVMLEAPLDNAKITKPYDPTIPKAKKNQTTEPTYRIAGYWRNDDFVPGVPGNDVGNTNSHGISFMQIGEDQYNLGISAETTLYTKRTGRARQKFIDKVDIKLLLETPGIKIGKLTVNARGEIGYTYISSKFRNNVNPGFGSTIQNSWHQAIGELTYENAIVAKGDEINVGDNGYSAKAMAVVSQLMISECGKCFMKWEFAAGGNVSQLKGSSYAEVSAAAKAGFNVGSSSSVYMESAYEVRQYGNHQYSNTSFGVGVDSGLNTFKYTVDIPKGSEGGIAQGYQDADWSGKLKYERKIGW